MTLHEAGKIAAWSQEQLLETVLAEVKYGVRTAAAIGRARGEVEPLVRETNNRVLFVLRDWLDANLKVHAPVRIVSAEPTEAQVRMVRAYLGLPESRDAQVRLALRAVAAVRE